MLCISVLLLFLQPSEPDLTYGELKSIMQLTNKVGGEVEEWELTLLDTISHEKYEEIMRWVKDEPAFINIQADENVSFSLKSDGYIHSNIEILKKDTTYKVAIVITSDQWNEKVQQALETSWELLERVLFTQTTRLYTCVSYLDSGIMIDGIYTEKVQEFLQMIPVYEQHDNIQGTGYILDYYGYNPSWNSKITVNNQEINFQMAIKNYREHKKQIIIGTPAILNEY